MQKRSGETEITEAFTVFKVSPCGVQKNESSLSNLHPINEVQTHTKLLFKLHMRPI